MIPNINMLIVNEYYDMIHIILLLKVTVANRIVIQNNNIQIVVNHIMIQINQILIVYDYYDIIHILCVMSPILANLITIINSYI